MTTLLLVRHGAHDRLNRYLDGRRPGVHLNDAGRRQAQSIAERLAREAVDAIHTSPLERTGETAAIIADRLGLEAQAEPALAEIDFGGWSGKTFAELEPLDDWRRWNAARSITPTPAGDSMRASQARMLDFVDARRQAEPDGTLVLVSHSDPLKALVAHYLGLSLDDLHRIEIAPASLSTIEIEPWGAKLVGLNELPPP